MNLPLDHPRRQEFNDEVHARPPETLCAPLRLSYLALFAEGAQRQQGWECVSALAARFGIEPPASDAHHFSADLGPFRVKCERHTEFLRFKFIVAGNNGTGPRQAGRSIARLMEINTYRILSLMALPIARALGPALAACERELTEITRLLIDARDADEPLLFERLTRLEAEIESTLSQNLHRFSAAAAYDDLVHRRIAELREERLAGMQTFREFTDRRLAPAMNTCRTTALKLESLSQRVARATQLLATRVEITREGQSQRLLESMHRRAGLQLRLQETVEGLSVAAITYYIVGLVVARHRQTIGDQAEEFIASSIAKL